MRKAFTLAEIMIVLTIIGVLTAILLPNAFQAVPDEAVLKFKKANTTLGNVIRELVYSDKYYADGDLGKKPDGTIIDGSDDTSKKYFCESFADVVSYKTKNCRTTSNSSYDYIDFSTLSENYTDSNVKTLKDNMDTWCASAQSSVKEEIVTADGITWFQADPSTTFGKQETVNSVKVRIFADPTSTEEPYKKDKSNGFDGAYKVLCLDVDELSSGVAPFGYGIRSDGKILPGTRAQEYIEKSIQKD